MFLAERWRKSPREIREWAADDVNRVMTWLAAKGMESKRLQAFRG